MISILRQEFCNTYKTLDADSVILGKVTPRPRQRSSLFTFSSIFLTLNSSIRQFVNSSIRQFVNSSIRQFVNSSIRQFVNSSIRQFFSSSIPQFHISSTLQYHYLYPALPNHICHCVHREKCNALQKLDRS
jgi:hypothetical protein